MLGGGAVNVCELFLVTRSLALPELRLSLAWSVFGIATVGASMFILTLSQRLSNTWPLVVAGLGGIGVCLLGMSLAPNFAWILFCNVIGGAGQAAMSIGGNSLIQAKVRKEFLTRVFGVAHPSAMAASLLGSWLGGMLADRVDVSLVFGGSAAIVLTASLLSYLLLSREKATGALPI